MWSLITLAYDVDYTAGIGNPLKFEAGQRTEQRLHGHEPYYRRYVPQVIYPVGVFRIFN